MPDSSALESFYQGFHPNLKAEAVMGRLDLAGALFGYLGMKPDGSRTFLDVGGGNGLFAKAFEVLGYGTSTYVDIDEVACRFVRNDLGIRSVRVCDVRELDVGYAEAFDLIYSRHLVEHLTDPLGFITKLASFRKPGGMLVVQCPNGDSLEYLPYFYSNVRDRFRKIRQATGWSKGRLLRCWLGGGDVAWDRSAAAFMGVFACGNTPMGRSFWSESPDLHAQFGVSAVFSGIYASKKMERTRRRFSRTAHICQNAWRHASDYDFL
jgi:SAM-dependent methyltransferase